MRKLRLGALRAAGGLLITGLLMASLLATALPGAANAAIQAQAPEPPPYGSSLAPPEAGTRVALLAETVLIEAAANRAEQVPYATVDATFRLRNNGEGEEQLELRYPLSLGDTAEGAQCALSAYQTLRYFQVWVNERATGYRLEYERVTNTLAAHSFDPPEVDRACWAVFPAVFPPGEEVTVRVRFEQEAGVEGYPGYAGFRYDRTPGTAWDGTVGRSEVVFRAPWFLTEETLLAYEPEDGSTGEIPVGTGSPEAQQAAKEIRWAREETEPGAADNVTVFTLNPPVYREINRGRLLYFGSRRGEAWGRYGLAAKRAIAAASGFRESEWSERLYHESFDAYSHAVELLPWNADWHAGFAELLCTNAAHPTFDLEWSDAERWMACARQIQAALHANPHQELARELMERYGDPQRMQMMSGTPEFPILSQTPPPRRTLTPTATATGEPTATAEVTEVPATPTERATESPTAAASATAAVGDGGAVGPETGSGGWALCGAGVIPLVGIGWMGRKRRGE